MSASLDPVVELTRVDGAAADPRGAASLVIEIPHGATETADFQRVAARLDSPLPADLVDFFHVNTDAGAPELALAVARTFVARRPSASAVIVRCRVPRTFIDCNRRLDAAPEEFRAGKVTPGLPPWITTEADRALLRDAYDRYVAAVRAAIAEMAPRGALLLLHTYAPRTVDVEIDLDIVANLRRAYTPEVFPTWPLRPEIDVISRDGQGHDHAPRAVVAALTSALAALGRSAATSATYPLHPSTLAYEHVMALPGRALCIEVRRDLLAEPFVPFAQMRIDAAKVAPLASAIAAAVTALW